MHNQLVTLEEKPTSPATKRARRTQANAARKKSPAQSKAKKPLSKAEQWRKLITGALDKNKAEDIASLDLKNKCSFTDFMVVASGRSARHVSSLADHVIDAIRKAGGQVLSVEGQDSGDWVLIDAGDVVVHIFRPEIRKFYNLEKMWAIPLPTQ